MVRTEHSLWLRSRRQKTDSEAADLLIGQYMGFIRSETVKFTHAAPENGHEDELSIAMLAFYEAILSYEKSRGAFLPYAARAIRNRLIDHYRTEKRHGNVISLHAPDDEEGDRSRLDSLPDTRDSIAEFEVRTASRAEIQEFGAQLAGFGISFSDVADNCPPAGANTGRLPPGAGLCAANPNLLEKLVETGRLPMNELAAGSGTDKKTMERHRKYLVAILLAFTNGYEIIRGHLCQIAPAKGGQGR